MKLRPIFLVASFLIISQTVAAQNFIPLWPAGHMPDSKGMALKDSIRNQRVYRISKPGLEAYFPSIDDNKGSAVIICPGGGYKYEAHIIGGTQLAKWFNILGMSAFVLDYRLPTSPDLKQRAIAPLQDAQRAMRIVRANAKKWNINPDKIGILGTSAGGHVASTLGTHQKQDVSAIGDSLDRYSYNPDFMVLLSPVITMGKYTHRGSKDRLLGKNPSKELVKKYSNELHVNNATPPTFLAGNFDDKAVEPHNELLFYRALLEHNISTSFHVFPHGGHPIHIGNNSGSTQLWISLCRDWLKETGFL